MDPAALASLILDEARALGFHRVGITPATSAPRFDVYRQWLAAGHAGDMHYLETDAASRADVRSLLPGAKSVVVVALSYGGLVPIRGVARYARGDDYHIVMKAKLAHLAEKIPAQSRSCVDTAPLLERDLAEAAGLGFVGKNCMLIAPGLGSWLLLGALVVDIELPPTTHVEPKRCGECRLCLDACPTGAFVDAHTLDARKCISYLTIEQSGVIPRELRPMMGTMIFGCDVCQEVCPFNAADRDTCAPELRPRLAVRDLIELAEIGAAQFRKLVKRTALRRIHRAQLLRNVAVALGNAGDPAAIPVLLRMLTREPPLVRAHAVWALGRLGADLTQITDEDPLVRGELPPRA